MSDEKNGFDHRVHIRDASGQVMRENHYRLHIVNGVSVYERPPFSGKFYNSNGAIMDLKDVPDLAKAHLKSSEPEAPKAQEPEPLPPMQSASPVEPLDQGDLGEIDEADLEILPEEKLEV